MICGLYVLQHIRKEYLFSCSCIPIVLSQGVCCSQWANKLITRSPCPQLEASIYGQEEGKVKTPPSNDR